MPSVVESFGPLILFHYVVLSQLRVNLMFLKYLLQAPMNTKSDISRQGKFICRAQFLHNKVLYSYIKSQEGK